MKPNGLVIGAALIMLALGKPLTGSRAFGGAMFSLPQMGDCKAMVSFHIHKSQCVEDQTEPCFGPCCRSSGCKAVYIWRGCECNHRLP